MNVKKPEPIYSISRTARKTCPVCGKIAYSLAGVHPQCSQVQADARLREKLKKSEAKSTPSATTTPSKQPDRALSREVTRRLVASGVLTSSHIAVRSQAGEVTLSGDLREAPLRRIAIKAAETTPGVRRVIDRMTVKGS